MPCLRGGAFQRQEGASCPKESHYVAHSPILGLRGKRCVAGARPERLSEAVYPAAAGEVWTCHITAAASPVRRGVSLSVSPGSFCFTPSNRLRPLAFAR